MKFLMVRASLQNNCNVGVGPLDGVQAPKEGSQEAGIQPQKERRKVFTLVSHPLPEDQPPRSVITSSVLPLGCSPNPSPICPQAPCG